MLISIHALREESDNNGVSHAQQLVKFQSTPSARRATVVAGNHQQPDGISIHALREESDAHIHILGWQALYFNPRPPRGERLSLSNNFSAALVFQSTPSARRATCRLRFRWSWRQDFNPRPPRGERLPVFTSNCDGMQISIHALREESDDILDVQSPHKKGFQSTPSARRATAFITRLPTSM